MKVTDDKVLQISVFFLNAFSIVKFRRFRFESPAIELENELFYSFNE